MHSSNSMTAKYVTVLAANKPLDVDDQETATRLVGCTQTLQIAQRTTRAWIKNTAINLSWPVRFQSRIQNKHTRYNNYENKQWSLSWSGPILRFAHCLQLAEATWLPTLAPKSQLSSILIGFDWHVGVVIAPLFAALTCLLPSWLLP